MKHSTRFLAILLCIALPCLSLFSRDLDSHPNIVLIIADDMGYGDSRVYNPKSQVPMPNLEKLANRGVVFTNAHSAAATCAPTRYSLLTGNYPWRGRKPGGTWRYNEPCQILEGQETIGSLLKRAGYRTAIFGKLHQGGHYRSKSHPETYVHEKVDNDHEVIDFGKRFERGPLDYGFDYSYIYPSGIQHEPYAAFENDVLDGDPSKLKTWSVGNYGLSVIPIEGVGLSDYDSSQVGPILTGKVLEFINHHIEENRHTKEKKPFYIHYCSQALHDPTTPPKTLGGHPVRGVTFSHPTDMFVELDVTLGLIIGALEEKNLLANTLIMVTSDNGGWWYEEYLEYNHRTNGPWKGSKGTIWEGGHRVPFIAAWGDGSSERSTVKPGRRVDNLISGQDIYATLAELNKLPMGESEGLDSWSFLPVLLGEENSSLRDRLIVQANQRGLEQDLIGEVMHAKSQGRSQSFKALLEGPWKLIVNTSVKKVEGLFNLNQDPVEEVNLIGNPEYKNQIHTMMDRFEEILQSERSTAVYEP